MDKCKDCKGKVYKLKAYKLPLGNPQARGRALVNLLPIEQDEKISTILALPENQRFSQRYFL